ncbi:reverse transcriptase domain-containing protein [Tanacetum coccineum]
MKLPFDYSSMKSIRLSKRRLLEACLVDKGITLNDNLVDMESTNDSVTSLYQLDESNSLGNDEDAEKFLVDTVASNIEYVEIGPSYNSTSFNDIIYDIPNMDQVRDKEEHDDVDDEQQHAFFTSLINDVKMIENRAKTIEESESDNLLHDHIQGEDENAEDVQMADHLRPMEELLRIPIIGIEDAIVVPAVPHDVVKLIFFSFSLKGAAETWIENEPPNSITFWDDLVSKFLNRFFPHSKTRELRKEITNFQQVFGETFTEAWERFKDLLRKCPHHGFSLLHQIDFFYNGLSQSDQDSLNTTAGGNLMMRNIQEALTTIENKARVRTCRNKPQVSSSGGTSTKIDAITALTKQVKALEYHFASVRETYDRNQEAPIQLMQNQMGQIAEAFQERPSCVPPSNTVTKPHAELKAITTMDGLTLDGSFTPHSNFLIYQEKKQEPETITEVVKIASSQSIPLVLPPETPPLSAPKPKEDPKPNPHQLLIQEEKFQALENPTGRADHFIYRIDIVDSLCDKFPIENNSLSGYPTPSSDFVVESLSPSPIPFRDSDSLVEETDILLSHFYDSSPDYETFCFDIEEKSSGSTTSHSNLSLPSYESFCFDNDHQEEKRREEKRSGSTTSRFDHSLSDYEALYFDDEHIEDKSSGSTTNFDFSLPE